MGPDSEELGVSFPTAKLSNFVGIKIKSTINVRTFILMIIAFDAVDHFGKNNRGQDEKDIEFY